MKTTSKDVTNLSVKSAKTIHDFVRPLRRHLEAILDSADEIDLSTNWSSEDIEPWSLEAIKITNAAKGLLDLVRKLERKAKAADGSAARGERFIRKPVNADMDDEFVKQHDRGLTFGQIAKQRGMKYDAVRKAYHRHKPDMSNCPG